MTFYINKSSIKKTDNLVAEKLLKLKEKELSTAATSIESECLKVWRLKENDKAVLLEEADFGYFYSQNAYVVLKVIRQNARLNFHFHFWVGSEYSNKSNIPEELINTLKENANKVVFHREVQGFESNQFKAYFKTVGFLSGNYNEAFDPVDVKKFKPKLYQFKLSKDKSKMMVSEVTISWKSLKSQDVFIYDEGMKMTQWNGSKCDEQERICAKDFITSQLKARRLQMMHKVAKIHFEKIDKKRQEYFDQELTKSNGIQTEEMFNQEQIFQEQKKTIGAEQNKNCPVPTAEFFDEEDLFEGNELQKKLGVSPVKEVVKSKPSKNLFVKELLRLSNESGKLEIKEVYKDKLYRVGINPNDVTFVNTFKCLYVYIGPGASEEERKNSLPEAIKYLERQNTANKSIAMFSAGVYLNDFEEIWDDKLSK